MSQEGTLSIVVWPVYAGALLIDGSEPISSHEYERGVITWELNEHGIMLGRVCIKVPVGEWGYIIYTHQPKAPIFSVSQKLVHPLRIQSPEAHAQGYINLEDITYEDINPLAVCSNRS